MLSLVTPYGRDAPSARVRGYAWLDHLGLESPVHNFSNGARMRPADLAAAYIKRLGRGSIAKRIDMSGSVLVLRRVGPIGDGRLEHEVLSSASHGVFDLDDTIFMPAAGGSARERLRRLVGSHLQPQRAAAAADVVIAGNEMLAEWASKSCGDVRVIPSCVEPEAYRHKHDYELSEHPRLLWVGSSTTEQHLRPLAGPLLRLNQVFGARLEIIGQPQGSLGALDAIVDRVPWSENTVHDRIALADVGLMPLPDNVITRGKCAYKLLQYGAAGLPAVGSPVGANIPILSEAGVPGPTGPDEWFDAIEGLLTMSARGRAERGQRLRDLVDQEFSYTRWASRWMDAVLPSAV